MTDLKEALPYLSTIIVIMGWFFTYFSNKRSKKHEMFLSKTEFNINGISGPIINEMNAIHRETDFLKRMNMLEKLIKKLSGPKSPLFLESSFEIIAGFRLLESAYYQYKSISNQENYTALWTEFAVFYERVKAKLVIYHQVLFKDYEWNYRMEQKGPFMRFLFETFRFIYEVLIGLIQLVLLIWLLILCDIVNNALSINKVQVLTQYIPFIFPATVIIFIFSALFYGLDHVIFNYKRRLYKPRVSKYSQTTIDRIKSNYPYPQFEDKVTES